MVLEALEDFLGPVPSGYEPLAYVIAAFVLLYLLSQVISVVWALVSTVFNR